MALKFVPPERFVEFLTKTTEGHDLYGHQTSPGEQPHMVRTKPENITLGGARAVEPLKSFVYPPREDLGDYFARTTEPVVRPTALVGLTACDLRALAVLDDVFLGGDMKDPYYEKRRQSLLILSMDCVAPFDVCFCSFFDQPPHPDAGYDLNLSPLAHGQDGYLLETGSDRGLRTLTAIPDLPDPTADQVARRDADRAASFHIVDSQARAAGLVGHDRITANFRESRDKRADFWPKHANKCVECGACNFICPACHCFLLADMEERGHFKRFKNWDSCLLLMFARVAGGANPRPRRVERLQNRFEKKFDFLPETIHRWGCTGCGRCTEACAGDIDIREVLRDILAC